MPGQQRYQHDDRVENTVKQIVHPLSLNYQGLNRLHTDINHSNKSHGKPSSQYNVHLPILDSLTGSYTGQHTFVTSNTEGRDVNDTRHEFQPFRNNTFVLPSAFLSQILSRPALTPFSLENALLASHRNIHPIIPYMSPKLRTLPNAASGSYMQLSADTSNSKGGAGSSHG